MNERFTVLIHAMSGELLCIAGIVLLVFFWLIPTLHGESIIV
jgi:hypothetical protein